MQSYQRRLRRRRQMRRAGIVADINVAETDRRRRLSKRELAGQIDNARGVDHRHHQRAVLCIARTSKQYELHRIVDGKNHIYELRVRLRRIMIFGKTAAQAEREKFLMRRNQCVDCVEIGLIEPRFQPSIGHAVARHVLDIAQHLIGGMRTVILLRNNVGEESRPPAEIMSNTTASARHISQQRRGRRGVLTCKGDVPAARQKFFGDIEQHQTHARVILRSD